MQKEQKPQGRLIAADFLTYTLRALGIGLAAAVVLGGAKVRPVTVSMYNYINTEQTQWAQLAAAALMAMLPVILLGILAQKHIVNGLTAGAVKGVGRR